MARSSMTTGDGAATSMTPPFHSAEVADEAAAELVRGTRGTGARPAHELIG
jgi:hypothetical protein